MRRIIYILVFCGVLGIGVAPAQTGKTLSGKSPLSPKQTQPTWESINRRGYPEWFSDAKLGIFIHWGLYSVPAYASKEGYAEWFYRGIMTDDTSRAQILAQINNCTIEEVFRSPIDQYSKLRSLWKAELWDPEAWAALFRESGARYVLLVTKHHDGYCLWDSPQQPTWNSTMSGPHRNIVEELTSAVRNQGLKMGFYYSLPEWTNRKHIWMQDNDRDISDYVENFMIPQFKDLITRYRPEILFTDGEWNNTAEEWHARELISWYYNTVGADAIVNDRWGEGCEHGFCTPEYSSGIAVTDRPWAECRGLGRSFGLNRNEDPANFLTSQELIQHFVKLVAAGGGMTLNVGPSADGRIPLIQQERLRDLGNWLNQNGEAIYGTRPSEKGSFLYKEVSVENIDSTIDFDWVRNAPHPRISYDNFTCDWEGEIIPEFTDKYIFRLQVDDNATVLLDGDTLLNYRKDFADGSQSNAQAAQNYGITSATRLLKKGSVHKLKVHYEEVDKEALIRLTWKSKLMKETPVTAKDGFSACYSCLEPYICFTEKDRNLYAILLDYWPEPGEQIVLKDRAPKAGFCRVSLLGSQKPVHWEIKGKDLIIDLNGLNYNDLKGRFNTFVLKIERF